ncbi:MAG: VIT domain-containing protein [Arenicellales bacterium]|jgi:hypothetical protein|nr:VIT domain-containing protein [Arenicellales bacterium]|tara:strand:+ start:202 stop:3486 length:3285 start_codon:yes stop_codon:yes gene_type:complete
MLLGDGTQITPATSSAKLESDGGDNNKTRRELMPRRSAMTFVLPALAFLVSLLMVPLSLAQEAPQNPSANALQDQSLRPPSLVVTDAGQLIPMLVDSLEVHVVIRGLLSETTMTMVFRNPHNRVLEGELVFPLPHGATVSGYGLDVGGQLVEGVVVEKHQARIVFEKEVRKDAVIDPGLVEHARGNSFRTRVYPIPARGTRTVMVRYVSELIGSPAAPVYLLPLRFDQPVGRFDLKAEVVRGTHRPAVSSDLSNFEFSRWEDRWVAKTSMTNAALTRDLRVALPQTPDLVVSVEHDGPEDIVFAIHHQPDAAGKLAHRIVQPKRVHLWWDASMSHGQEERETELEFLRGLLGHWNNLTLDITPFRDQPGEQRSFVIRNGETSAVEVFLENLPYDGGTDLADIKLDRSFGRQTYDLHLLVSDGIGTIGKVPATPGIPVFTLTAAGTADHMLLKHLANTSGGAHLNLGVMTIEMALELVGLKPFSLLGVDYNPEEVTELYPETRRPVAGRRLHVSGKLIAEETTVVLRYGYGSTEVSRREVRLRRSDASDTGLVPRFWAQQKMTAMMMAPELDRDHLLALGRRYGIVTAETSLLVLETLEQHLEYGIEPPQSRPELKRRWLASTKRQKTLENGQTARQFRTVFDLWQARKHWWQTDFSRWHKRQSMWKLEEFPPALRRLLSLGNGSGNTSSEQLRRTEAEHLRRTEEVEMRERAIPRQQPSRYLERELHVQNMEAPSTRRRIISEDYPVARAESESVNSEAPRVADTNTKDTETITLTPWDPRIPYMANLKSAAKSGRAYQVYLDQRAGFGNSPAYFLDCAVFLQNQNQPQLARRVLTSILELGLDQPDLLRVVGYRLIDVGDLDIAIQLFKDVLEMRPEEPQSYRDLADVLALRWEDATWRLTHQQQADFDISYAMSLLHQVVLGKWDRRLQEIQVTALMELNRLLAKVDRLLPEEQKRILQPSLDPSLIGVLDVGLRIVLSWDSDLTDIDLWVTEPTGNKVFYKEPLSIIGGLLSRDFTLGYGPEEYLLKEPIPGNYKIRARYYEASQRKLLGPVTAKAVIFTNWARPDEKRQELTFRLNQIGQFESVGDVRIN